MHTEKVCVACLATYTDDDPGVAGVLTKQDKPVGVCPSCKHKRQSRIVLGVISPRQEEAHGSTSGST